MGDFIINFDPERKRGPFLKAADFIKFHEYVSVNIYEFPEFSLALSSVDNSFLWGPYDSDNLFVALCGRVDFEDQDWAQAELSNEAGGLATKRIAQLYRSKGANSLRTLSGNFALLLWDRQTKQFWIVSDLCGAQPVFKFVKNNVLAFGSHADSLAIAVEEDHQWNETSLLEFLLTSSVSPPFTYYKHISSLNSGTEITIDLTQGNKFSCKEFQYYELKYRGTEAQSEDALAEELSLAIRNSIRKRTHPRFGPIAVALSGGLDSRTVLAAAPDRSDLFAFSTFNKENFEFQSARSIAEALDVKFVPIPRSFEFYGDTAALGIRINGGMGTFANNHFLGLAPRLRELGTQTLLTGCYFDYLFKGLPLNLRTTGFLKKEKLGPYSHQFYFDHYHMDIPGAQEVIERLDNRFPAALRSGNDEEQVFRLEVARTFPLFQEADNAQRLIPQRVLFSYLAVADRSILDVYSRIPYRYKLNRSIFKKAMERICGPVVSSIRDTNTGAQANAGHISELAHRTLQRMKRKVRKLKPELGTDGSWPDWAYYIANSRKLAALWQEPCPAADEFFRKHLLTGSIKRSPSDYKGKDQFFFIQLMSLKLWFSQRC